MAMKTVFLAGLAAATALGGCGKKDEAGVAEKSPTKPPIEKSEPAAARAAPAADAKLAAENLAAGRKFLAESGKRLGVKTQPSGLQFEILEEGAAGGAAPGENDIVDIDYVGTKIDGVEFDSSRAQGAAARFPIAVVAGSWTEEALKLMTIGDRFRFYVPADLAFGETGAPGGPVGPNEALIYEVTLVKVTNLETNLKAGQAFLAANAARPGVKSTGSGLQYLVLAEGPAGGKKPSDANIVRVHYKGTLLDGTEFDSSHARGEPAEFPLGQVIAGWTEGVQLMSVGDKFRFFIPAPLAYGQSGTAGGPIGPNEALIFDVELIEVK